MVESLHSSEEASGEFMAVRSKQFSPQNDQEEEEQFYEQQSRSYNTAND